MKNNKKWIWIVCGSVFVLVVVVLVATLFKVAKNSTLNIYVTPISAKVLIDGGEYQNGTYEFFPGEYVATIRAEGFEDKKIELKLDANLATNLFTFLEGNDEYYEYVANSDDYAVLEQVAKYDKAAQALVDSIEEKKKIYDKLPIIVLDGGVAQYSLQEGTDCERTLCLKVYNQGGNYYDEVVVKIRELGFNEGDYEIINMDWEGKERL